MPESCLCVLQRRFAPLSFNVLSLQCFGDALAFLDFCGQFIAGHSEQFRRAFL